MDLEIALDPRDVTGKATKRLRRAGVLPAVVYGKGEASTAVQVDAKVFDALYRSAGRTSVVQLTLPDNDGAKSGIIKAVQRHPVSGRPLHVDFMVIDLKQEMGVDVPLQIVGTAPAVEETGGTLLSNLDHVRVRALPNDIPHEIEVNVSTLISLDVAIHVRDLSLNRDLVQVVTDGDELVAKVMPPRVEEEPEIELPEEELEGEGAEAAEGAEGAAEGEARTGEGGAEGEESGSES